MASVVPAEKNFSKTRGKSSNSLASMAGGSGTSDAASSSISSSATPTPPTAKFAQVPGDGGLVKGVLAHAAALAGRSKWC